MDVLPPELILEIVKYLPIRACLNLAQTSTHYTWLLKEIPLWKLYTTRNLKYGQDQFNYTTANPVELYRNLSRCHEDDDGPCNHPIIPGIPYCCYHCRMNGYEVCHYCRENLVNLIDGVVIKLTPRHHFCQECWNKRRYEHGCKFIVEIEEPKQCGAQRVPGSDYCKMCLDYLDSAKSYQSDHPPELRHQLEYNGPPINMVPMVFICPYRNISCSMIADGPLIGTIIKKRPDGVIIAISKYPQDQPLRWFREEQQPFDHPHLDRGLTNVENQLAQMMGFWIGHGHLGNA
jgi:hypothetical protein